VNSVLSSLPTYTMCEVEVPVAVLDYIERARRHCMGRGSHINARGKDFVALQRSQIQRTRVV
jgi:hypothetical protein